MNILNKPFFWLIFFIVVNILLITYSSLLPFVDLPNHLAEATIFKYYGHPDNKFSQYYQLTPWYFPNSFYLLFTSLFPTIELGNKVFFILYIALLPTAIFFIIKELGGNLWYGLLSFLLIYNYNVTYGFVGFYMAIPITLLFFYILLLDNKEKGIKYKIIASMLLILIFYMHAQVALFALMLFMITMLFFHWKRMKELLLSSLVCLPVICLIIFWWFARESKGERGIFDFLIDYYSKEYFLEFYKRSSIIFMDHSPLLKGIPGILLGVAFSGLIIFPLLYFKIWKRVELRQLTKGKQAYAFLFFLIALACYTFLPYGLPGQIPLYQRFCTLVVLSFIILGSMLLPSTGRTWTKVFFLCTIGCYSLFWSEYIYSFNQENKHFNKKFFAGIENKSRMAALIYDHEYRGRSVYLHFPNYFIVWKKGIATTRIIDFRFGVIRRNASLEKLPLYDEWIGASYKKDNRYRNLEYILVRGRAPVKNDINLSGFSLLKERGTWKLYKNNRLTIMEQKENKRETSDLAIN